MYAVCCIRSSQDCPLILVYLKQDGAEEGSYAGAQDKRWEAAQLVCLLLLTCSIHMHTQNGGQSREWKEKDSGKLIGRNKHLPVCCLKLQLPLASWLGLSCLKCLVMKSVMTALSFNYWDNTPLL